MFEALDDFVGLSDFNNAKTSGLPLRQEGSGAPNSTRGRLLPSPGGPGKILIGRVMQEPSRPRSPLALGLGLDPFARPPIGHIELALQSPLAPQGIGERPVNWQGQKPFMNCALEPAKRGHWPPIGLQQTISTLETEGGFSLGQSPVIFDAKGPFPGPNPGTGPCRPRVLGGLVGQGFPWGEGSSQRHEVGRARGSSLKQNPEDVRSVPASPPRRGRPRRDFSADVLIGNQSSPKTSHIGSRSARVLSSDLEIDSELPSQGYAKRHLSVLSSAYPGPVYVLAFHSLLEAARGAGLEKQLQLGPLEQYLKTFWQRLGWRGGSEEEAKALPKVPFLAHKYLGSAPPLEAIQAAERALKALPQADAEGRLREILYAAYLESFRTVAVRPPNYFLKKLVKTGFKASDYLEDLNLQKLRASMEKNLFGALEKNRHNIPNLGLFNPQLELNRLGRSPRVQPSKGDSPPYEAKPGPASGAERRQSSTASSSRKSEHFPPLTRRRCSGAEDSQTDQASSAGKFFFQEQVGPYCQTCALNNYLGVQMLLPEQVASAIARTSPENYAPVVQLLVPHLTAKNLPEVTKILRAELRSHFGEQAPEPLLGWLDELLDFRSFDYSIPNSFESERARERRLEGLRQWGQAIEQSPVDRVLMEYCPHGWSAGHYAVLRRDEKGHWYELDSAEGLTPIQRPLGDHLVARLEEDEDQGIRLHVSQGRLKGQTLSKALEVFSAKSMTRFRPAFYGSEPLTLKAIESLIQLADAEGKHPGQVFRNEGSAFEHGNRVRNQFLKLLGPLEFSSALSPAFLDQGRWVVHRALLKYAQLQQGWRSSPIPQTLRSELKAVFEHFEQALGGDKRQEHAFITSLAAVVPKLKKYRRQRLQTLSRGVLLGHLESVGALSQPANFGLTNLDVEAVLNTEKSGGLTSEGVSRFNKFFKHFLPGWPYQLVSLKRGGFRFEAT